MRDARNYDFMIATFITILNKKTGKYDFQAWVLIVAWLYRMCFVIFYIHRERFTVTDFENNFNTPSKDIRNDGRIIRKY